MALSNDAPSNRNILEINADGYLYYIYPLKPGKGIQKKPSFSMSRPGQGPTNNIAMGFQGQTRKYTINFFLYEYDKNWDRSEGSVVGDTNFNDTNEDEDEDVITIAEQIDYIENYIHNPSFDASWTLKQVESFPGEKRLNRGNAINIFIEDFDYDLFSKGGKWLEAKLEIGVGSTIT